MKPQLIESINYKNLKKNKNKNFCSYDKIKCTSPKIKLSCQTSPQKLTIQKNQTKIINDIYKLNNKEKINTKLNIITKDNLNINSILYKPKLKKNKTHTKYIITSNTDNNIGNSTHFQTSSYNNNSYINIININKQGKKITLYMDENKKIKNTNESNSSKLQNNNNSQLTEQYNNINSYYETNNSSDNNKKKNIDYFSLNKTKPKAKKSSNSYNNSLNNTNSNHKLKNNNLYFDKFHKENLFQNYQGNVKKKKIKIQNKNKNEIYNINNETYNKSIYMNNISFINNNFSFNNSTNKIKTKSNTNVLTNSNITLYNNKKNKNDGTTKQIRAKVSHGKKPIIINNNNSNIYNLESTIKKNKSLKNITSNNIYQNKDKEKIDVQITSINNLLNNKFIKEINNLQNEMDKNIKLNQANSKTKKYNALKHFFEKFLKKLNEYLNKNTFNCINLFLQTIISGYHEIITSFSSENKDIHKLNLKLNITIEDLQKMQKDLDKKINMLQKQNDDLCNQIKMSKKTSKDNIEYISCDLYSKEPLEDKKNIKNKVEKQEQEYNNKVFKLNKKNLDDLDALYFFDKINMKNKRASSKEIPLIPIIEDDDDDNLKIKKSGKKKKKHDKNNYFLKIKQAFE